MSNRLSLLIALLLVMILSPITVAQTAWEVTPYKVKVLLATDRSPDWSPVVTQQIENHLHERAKAIFGAAWELDNAPVPAVLVYDLTTRPERLNAKRVAAAVDAKDLRQLDKIILVGLRRNRIGVTVHCREFDCHTRSLSPVTTRHSRQMSVLGESAVQAMVDAFSPIVRFGRTQEDVVPTRLRAGSLIVDPESPAALKKGDILLPVIRKNDRLGDPRPDGIAQIEWTFLVAGEPEGFATECKIYSGRRNPLRGRASISTERLATRVRSGQQPTKMTLSSAEEPGKPLAGFEVLAGPPGDKRPEKLGRTDWKGSIRIPAADNEIPLVMVYVRNGRHPIARLPVIPGRRGNVEAVLPSNTVRQQADAILVVYRTELIDLVYRRALLTARINFQIEKNQQQSALDLLEEYRSLPTLSKMESQLVRKHGLLPISDERTSRQIKRYFDEMRDTTRRYVKPDDDKALELRVKTTKPATS